MAALDNPLAMVHHYGMTKTKHRTTFSLDDLTARRLRRLSSRWQVSQAEVVRRSVEQAERALDIERPDPVVRLEHLHQQGHGLDAEAADRRIASVRQDREAWRSG